MRVQTRRTFLTTSSAAVTGLALGVHSLRAMTTRTLARGTTARTWLPEPTPEDLLQHTAALAVDAAHTTGASYADVRVGQTQSLLLGLKGGQTTAGINLETSLSYGIRVFADGMWGFAYGNTLTTDAVTRTARNAVARARAYARVTRQPVMPLLTLAPNPAMTAQWTTPVQYAPFDVPILDQADRLGALNAAALRAIDNVDSTANWNVGTTIFASTEGSFLTQHTTQSTSEVRLGGRVFSGLVPALAGVEILLAPTLEEDLKAFAEETARLLRLSARLIDVGRYPIVLNGASTAALMHATLLPGLELDRVLRYETDGAGISYLAPPEATLGTMITAPSVTVTMNRDIPRQHSPDEHGAEPDATRPRLGAVPWDAEGIVPVPVTLIEQGRLVDYITTRALLPAMTEWYTKQGKPLRAQGAAVSPTPTCTPAPVAAEVQFVPNPSHVSLDDLTKEVTRGVCVMDAHVRADHGLSSGILGGALLLGVERGRITCQLRGVVCQFRTPTLWRGLNGVGEATTVTTTLMREHKGNPPQEFPRTIAAPATRFSAIDVIHTARRA